MGKELQDFVEKVNYAIAQEIERRLAAMMPVDWQSSFAALLEEIDRLIKLNETLTKQIEELRKNKSDPKPEPSRPKLVAWVHKDSFTSGAYACAIYGLEDGKWSKQDWVRAPWLDQEFLEALESRDVK